MNKLVERALQVIVPFSPRPKPTKRIVLFADIPGCSKGIGEGHSIILEETFMALEECMEGKRKKIIVLAPSDEIASRYAHRIAVHFHADFEISGALLCHGHGSDIPDVCECMEDYLLSDYGLVVVVAHADLVGKLASQLSVRVGRPLRQVHRIGKAPSYFVI
jgi:hypothetical protein